MLTRRDYLRNSAMIGAACALPGGLSRAFASADLITRAIPKSGEELPIVGLGTSATFRSAAQRADISALRDVIETLLRNGGTVLDTAPSYGSAEDISGRIARDGGMTNKLFWATKVNVVARGSNGSADPAAARAQIQRSFDRIGKDPVDLIQVHNLADLPTQMGIIRELKEEGRIRYIGTTSTSRRHYPDL
ncbi:MAG: aldo/keto reductase, partial [Gammaproteobacteria bacterium]|nr:aldo/keto reductase [Gammaproteobacteria bacterium]